MAGITGTNNTAGLQAPIQGENPGQAPLLGSNTTGVGSTNTVGYGNAPSGAPSPQSVVSGGSNVALASGQSLGLESKTVNLSPGPVPVNNVPNDAKVANASTGNISYTYNGVTTYYYSPSAATVISKIVNGPAITNATPASLAAAVQAQIAQAQSPQATVSVSNIPIGLGSPVEVSSVPANAKPVGNANAANAYYLSPGGTPIFYNIVGLTQNSPEIAQNKNSSGILGPTTENPETLSVTPQSLQLQNLSVTPLGAYQGTVTVNGVTYSYSGNLPVGYGYGPWTIGPGQASQKAIDAINDGVYQYLSSTQGLSSIPSGSEVSVNLNTGAASVQSQPGTGTLTQQVETQTAPSLIPKGASSGFELPGVTPSSGIVKVVTVPSAFDFTGQLKFANEYGINPAEVGQEAGKPIIITGSNFDPTNLQDAEAYGNAVIQYANQLQAAGIQPAASSGPLPNQPTWYTTILNAATRGDATAASFAGSLAAAARISPASFEQQPYISSIAGALPQISSQLPLTEESFLLAHPTTSSDVSYYRPYAPSANSNNSNPVYPYLDYNNIYNTGINSLASTQYNPEQPLTLSYLKNTLGSLLSSARSLATNPINSIGRLPGQYANLQAQSNQLAAEGAVPSYFPLVTEGLVGTPLAIGSAGGAGLAGLPASAIAKSIAGGAIINPIIGAAYGQTSPIQIAQNIESGGFTGAAVAPLIAGAPLTTLTSRIIDALPDSTSTLVENAVSTLGKISESSLNMATFFAANTALQSESQGVEPSVPQLIEAAKLGAVVGAIFGAAVPIGQAVGAASGNPITSALANYGTQAGITGTAGVGLNAVEGNPINPIEAFGISAGLPLGLQAGERGLGLISQQFKYGQAPPGARLAETPEQYEYNVATPTGEETVIQQYGQQTPLDYLNSLNPKTDLSGFPLSSPQATPFTYTLPDGTIVKLDIPTGTERVTTPRVTYNLNPEVDYTTPDKDYQALYNQIENAAKQLQLQSAGATNYIEQVPLLGAQRDIIPKEIPIRNTQADIYNLISGGKSSTVNIEAPFNDYRTALKNIVKAFATGNRSLYTQKVPQVYKPVGQFYSNYGLQEGESLPLLQGGEAEQAIAALPSSQIDYSLNSQYKNPALLRLLLYLNGLPSEFGPTDIQKGTSSISGVNTPAQQTGVFQRAIGVSPVVGNPSIRYVLNGDGSITEISKPSYRVNTEEPQGSRVTIPLTDQNKVSFPGVTNELKGAIATPYSNEAIPITKYIGNLNSDLARSILESGQIPDFADLTRQGLTVTGPNIRSTALSIVPTIDPATGLPTIQSFTPDQLKSEGYSFGEPNYNTLSTDQAEHIADTLKEIYKDNGVGKLVISQQQAQELNDARDQFKNSESTKESVTNLYNKENKILGNPAKGIEFKELADNNPGRINRETKILEINTKYVESPNPAAKAKVEETIRHELFHPTTGLLESNIPLEGVTNIARGLFPNNKLFSEGGIARNFNFGEAPVYKLVELSEQNPSNYYLTRDSDIIGRPTIKQNILASSNQNNLNPQIKAEQLTLAQEPLQTQTISNTINPSLLSVLPTVPEEVLLTKGSEVNQAKVTSNNLPLETVPSYLNYQNSPQAIAYKNISTNLINTTNTTVSNFLEGNTSLSPIIINKISTEISNEILKNISEAINNIINNQNESNVNISAEGLAEKISENLSEKISEDLSEKLNENLSEKLSENLSEELAEQLAEQLAQELALFLSEEITSNNKDLALAPPLVNQNAKTTKPTNENEAETFRYTPDLLVELFPELNKLAKENFNPNFKGVQLRPVLSQEELERLNLVPKKEQVKQQIKL